MRETVEQRFWRRVNRSEECWEWTAARTGNGYGNVYFNGRYRVAHQVSYELLVGPIPEGRELDHICSNRACVRPEHLRPVTRKQNMEHRKGAQSNSISGYRGVYFDGRPNASKNPYYVQVNDRGRRYLGGRFDNPKEAAEVARKLRNRIFTHYDEDRSDTA